MENFSELKLSPALARSVKELGYEKPTPIQAQAIPILLGPSTDFLGLAATGTGKTAAFDIPLIERIETSKVQKVQGLVLCPTRELCLQVANQLIQLGKNKHVTVLPVYGGTGFMDQIHGLRKGASVVVATPGRLVDHLNRGNLALENVHTVILDEADEMISMGFKDDLEFILKHTKKRNVWLFSATMSPELRRVANIYMKDPQFTQVNKTEMLSSTVEQTYYLTREANKIDLLCQIMDAVPNFYGLIFCQTKALVGELTEILKHRGYHVDCLHGDKDQKSREKAMGLFRQKKVKIMVCTDVAARGLDVKDLTHVINYSLPQELESYVHRIGRTARSGQSGTAISLVTPQTMGLIPRIEKMTKSSIQQGVLPTRKEIAGKKVQLLLGDFQKINGAKKVEELLSEEWLTALNHMPKAEIASRFLALINPEFLKTKDEVPLHIVHRKLDQPKPRGSSTRRWNAGKKSYQRRF